MGSIYEPILEPLPALTPNTSSPAVLIDTTTQPAPNANQSLQPEGRGTVTLEDRFVPPSLFERLGAVDGISPTEHAIVGAALRAYDRTPRTERSFYTQSQGITDGTTGNVVIPLFTVPGDIEARVTQVLVDVPASATINPAAPYANASSWSFIAVSSSIGLGGSGSGNANASADALRRGLVAFAPTSAAGPILPGQWTFNEDESPVATGGETIFYVLHGGSIAALLSLSLQVTLRANLLGGQKATAL